MPRKKKETEDEELEKKGKKGGKNPKNPKVEEDTEIEEISIEEALELLAKESKDKKGKKGKNDNPYKGMDIHERNLVDDEKFIFEIMHTKYVVQKVGMDSLKLNSQLGMFAFGLCSMTGEIFLHDSMHKDMALSTFVHELTHSFLFVTQCDTYEEEGVSDEYICQFVSIYLDDINRIVNEFKKSALFKTFEERDI